MPTVEAVQSVRSPDVQQNIASACRLVQEAAAGGSTLLTLPEYLLIMCLSDGDKVGHAEKPGSGPIQDAMAEAARTHAVIFWASSVPWIGAEDSGGGWADYAEERREIANFIAQSGIKNLVILSGGAEMPAADDGANSDYSTARGGRITALHAAALDLGVRGLLSYAERLVAPAQRRHAA